MSSSTKPTTNQILHDGVILHKYLHDSNRTLVDSIYDLGAVDGDDISTILSNLTKPVFIPNGSFHTSGQVSVNHLVSFGIGSLITVDNGTLAFNGGVDSGAYKIFNTADDFYADPVAVPSVKIATGRVMPEWFGAITVSSYDDILNQADCSDSFMKAWRATTGEYTVNVTSTYQQSEYMHSYIYLSSGKYKLDRPTFLGHSVYSPTFIRWNKNGGGVIGEGSGNSLLVYTDSNYQGDAFFTAQDMSGEMHTFRGFKCVFFDPTKTGEDRYISKVGGMMLFTSIDSLQTYDLWAAGATKLVADANGFSRGGVGIQFDSVVDHLFDKLLTEHNVNGICFSSCVSTGSNIKGFSNSSSDVGFGNFIPNWPPAISQTTKNLVAISGLESKASRNVSISVGTYENYVDITGVVVDGRIESAESVSTNSVIGLGIGARLSGRVTGVANFLKEGVANDYGVSFLGTWGAPLTLDFIVTDVTRSGAGETALVGATKTDSQVIASVNAIRCNIPFVLHSAAIGKYSLSGSYFDMGTGGSGTNTMIVKGGTCDVTSYAMGYSPSVTSIAYCENATLILPNNIKTDTRVIVIGTGGVIKANALVDFA